MIERVKTEAKLYLISTPIGNLKDITYRALEIIEKVDVLYAEDTRVTNKLLNHYHISKSLKIYHDHNEEQMVYEIKNALSKGLSVGIVSDAGTPMINDPGYTVVKAIKDDYQIVSIPGASAYLTALTSSGLIPQPHTFIGFLDTKQTKRIKTITLYKYTPTTLIFYERGSRLKETINDLYKILGMRKAVIARELTKLHETFYEFDLKEDITVDTRGEFVLLVEGYQRGEISDERIKEEVAFLMKQGLTKKDAIIEASLRLDVKKNRVYEVMLK
ncbi:MAG: 16S rRNA (cytidine(1402)-2'-O)-methyltransferase [Acholeplasmataceae bacterium]